MNGPRIHQHRPQRGASLLRDGRDVFIEDYEGNFLGPTVPGGMDENIIIAREEIFDPVLGVASISGLEAGIDWINRTDFANTASLFAECGFEARRSHDRVDSGNLAIDAGSAAPVPFLHFGGLNGSFFGDLHARGDDAVRFYTDETVYIEQWPDAMD